MIQDFSQVIEALNGVNKHLLQVAVYHNPTPHCVVILDSDPPNLLDSLKDLRDYTQKRKLPYPLLVNKQFVLDSLDSYPLEFLDIVSSNYENLYAKEDVLKGLRFNRADLRLQMEREVKSKWLLTRLTILEQNPKPKALAQTLALSIHAILPVLKGLCYIYDRPIPIDAIALIAQAGDACKMNLTQLGTWLQLSEADTQIAKTYLDILQQLMNHVEADIR